MPRIARFLKEDEPTVYHVISRTALDGLPFKDEDKEYLLKLIKKWSKIFFVDVLGFAIKRTKKGTATVLLVKFLF